jgi:hypothetical protein
MYDATFFMHLLLIAFTAGLIGTAGMSIFIYSRSTFGFSGREALSIIGRLVTESPEQAPKAGAILHAAAGVLFAICYTILILAISPAGVMARAGTGALIGLAHGFTMSYVMVISVAEHHPVIRLREAGIGLALLYLLGHVIYGILVGLVVGLMTAV